MKTLAVCMVLALSSLCSAAPPSWSVRVLCYENEDHVVDSAGSGTLTRYGVLTNNHVIKDAKRVVVVFPDHTTVDVKVKKKDVTRDLALLVGKFEGRRWIELAKETPKKGTACIIQGYGQFNHLTQRGKIITFMLQENTNRQIFMEMQPCKARPGDSGGTITNLKGELIGVLWGSGPIEPKKNWGKPMCGYTFGTKVEEVHQFIGKKENPYDILRKMLVPILTSAKEAVLATEKGQGPRPVRPFAL